MIPAPTDTNALRVDRIATLRSAASDGSAESRCRLAAALLSTGQPEEALSLYVRAALAGHDGAQVEFGRMLLFGIGCEADPAQAVEWLMRAEKQCHPVASYWLAWIALGSVLLPRDESMNQRLRIAVGYDHPPALRAAALHYGRRPGAADQQACIALLERASHAGDVVASLLLAERLQRGEGCPAQPRAAANLRTRLRQQSVEPLPATVAPRSTPGGTMPRTQQALPIALEDALSVPPAQLLSEQPRVSRVDGLLSTDECRMLIALAMLNDPGCTATPALQLDLAHEDLALRAVQLRLARAAHSELAQAEPILVERRVPGAPGWPQRDYLSAQALAADHPEAGDRQRTLCVYLHEPEAGGGHEFPFGLLETLPMAGSALVVDNLLADGRQDSYSMHAARPVERGEQWQATLRLRERRYRPV